MDAVGICNLALGWLGEKAIDSLDEEAADSTAEELCARMYPEALRAVLEARTWTFATVRIDLSPATPTGLADFPSKYLLPGTVVRVLSCDDGGGSQEIEWRREGAFILTQSSPVTLKAKVITLEEDAAKFSPGFVRVLAARLAADLATPLATSPKLALAMEQKYIRELSQAGRLDGMQGSSESTRSSGLAARRW